MLKNLMYVTIYVSDLDQALAFYTDGLGLEKHIDHPGPDGRFLTVAPRDASVEILLWPGQQERPVSAAESGIAPGSIFLESEDPRRDVELFRDRGVTFVEPEPIDYPFGVRITAVDTDGNRIELRQTSRGRRSTG
jgi:catechol 2,3-dioxygenase-like lactoylglutathione lyase family enzyme